MRIIQCELVPRFKNTLYVGRVQSKMQVAQDELGLLDEHIFPTLFCDYDEIGDIDIAIDIDETILSLLENHKIVKVFLNHLDFGDYTYTFVKGGESQYETEVPSLRYICIFPELNFDQEVVLEDTLLKLDNGVSYVINTLWKDESAEKFETRINGAFIEPGLCKVSMERDSIVCFDYGIKKRFVAPIVK